MSYAEVLEAFWERMGGATGALTRSKVQYKNGVWPTTLHQRQELVEFIHAKCGKDSEKAKKLLNVLDNRPAAWWDAEEYHQNFYGKRKN